MRSNVVTFLLALFVVGQTAVAFATSGWDRHSVDIESRYRIHGANGNSFVSQLDANGNPIDPPLFTLNHDGFCGRPEYIVTTTHIVLRYDSNLPRRVEDDPKRLYFAVRKSDSFVTGPLIDDAFSTSSFGVGEKLHWIRPNTAADSFGRFLGVVLMLITCLLLSPIIFLIHRKRRRRRLMERPTHTANA